MRERVGERENLKSKTGTGYMRRIFFINCGGTPYCVTLYTTCMSMSVCVFVNALLHVARCMHHAVSGTVYLS